MNCKVILLGLLVLSSGVFAEDRFIVRFDLTTQMKSFLKQNELDVTGVNYQTNEIEALLTQDEIDQIQSEKTTVKFSFPQTLVAAPDKQYKKPDEIEDFVKNIHAHYPDITAIMSIGKSLEGRDIWAIKISDNASFKENEPAILVNAMHHAREVMTPEITTDMVEYLTSQYGRNPEVTRWVDNSEIWIIPMFNVDGNYKMWTEDSMWRKNTRNGHGVDINRNYPHGWNSCQGSSSNKRAQDYRGSSPASEPETQAMMRFVAEIKPVFNISYHSYSEIVIYPFGCKPLRTPAEEAVETIGKEIGQKIKYRAGTAWELLYNADGGDIDWMYAAHQVIPYVIEVNSTGQGFHPSYARWRDQTVERNRPGWMHLVSRLQGPSIQGRVRIGEFTHIQIVKSGKRTVAQTYRINPDGSFYVILNPGMYDVHFVGANRRAKQFMNLNVNKKLMVKF